MLRLQLSLLCSVCFPMQHLQLWLRQHRQTQPQCRCVLPPPEALLVPFVNRSANNWARKLKKDPIPHPKPCGESGDSCGVSINRHYRQFENRMECLNDAIQLGRFAFSRLVCSNSNNEGLCWLSKFILI